MDTESTSSTASTITLPSVSSPPATKKRKFSSYAEQKRVEQSGQLWIKWEDSPARAVILDDLVRGKLPLTEQEMSTQQAWEFYQKLDEFGNVCFSQFRERLASHRRQVTKVYRVVQDDEDAFRKDQARGYIDTRTHNHRGELIIHLSVINDLVSKDVMDGKHNGLTPSEFQATRPEYRTLDNKKFKEKLYQEIKLQKFYFHWDEERKKKGGRKVAAKYDRVE